jgi:hypothetical protein
LQGLKSREREKRNLTKESTVADIVSAKTTTTTTTTTTTAAAATARKAAHFSHFTSIFNERL